MVDPERAGKLIRALWCESELPYDYGHTDERRSRSECFLCKRVDTRPLGAKAWVIEERHYVDCLWLEIVAIAKEEGWTLGWGVGEPIEGGNLEDSKSKPSESDPR